MNKEEFVTRRNDLKKQLAELEQKYIDTYFLKVGDKVEGISDRDKLERGVVVAIQIDHKNDPSPVFLRLRKDGKETEFRLFFHSTVKKIEDVEA